MNQQQTSDLAFHERFFYRFFKKQIQAQQAPGQALDPHHLISPEEQAQIRQLYRKALLIAAGLGVTGVLLLYIPGILFPDSYLSQTAHTTNIALPFLGAIPFSIYFTIYGIILAVIEILALMYLNLWVVKRIALICQFPNFNSQDYERHIKILFDVSLEKRDKGLLKFGINPVAGLSKFNLMLYSTLNILKATLSNLFVKVLLSRVLGRFAIRAFIDLVGVPIFAFWNMYATHRVIREAKVRIMAPNLIKAISRQIYKEFEEDVHFRNILYDILQFIATAKRNFHHNHLLLVEALHYYFQFDYKDQKFTNEAELLEEVKALPQNVQEGLAKLLAFGMLIDGKLSRRESRYLNDLKEELQLDFDYSKLKQWELDFIEGRGLASLFESKFLIN